MAAALPWLRCLLNRDQPAAFMMKQETNMSLTNMSLDRASHPGRSKPEELVPSRYVVRVGDIEVLVVSDGVLPLPTAMLGHNADPAIRAAWLKNMFLPPDAF